ncbi:MAG TPA: hypothetical protein VIG57_01805 [Candidatus Entotheonella sp.]|jgi:hypothetical protein
MQQETSYPDAALRRQQNRRVGVVLTTVLVVLFVSALSLIVFR